MKLYYPDIFPQFHCIGSDCKDNCCKMGWDIEIDNNTFSFYKGLSDDFGKTICDNISCDDGCHYIKQKNGGCPFLNEKGLCSVLLKYGEDRISEICANHPRFFEWFGGYKEAGTGLCCEKSARLWLDGSGDKITFSSSETDEEDDDLEFDEILLKKVISARNMLIGIVQDRSLTIVQRMAVIIDYAQKAQDCFDYEDFESFDKLTAMYTEKNFQKETVSNFEKENFQAETKSVKKVMSFFEKLDYINSSFEENIVEISSGLSQLIKLSESFDSKFPEAQKHYENILCYGIFRYFIKATRNYDCLSKIIFAVLNVWFARLSDLLCYCKSDGNFALENQIEIVKEFSKEVEYSDNMDTITDEVYDNNFTYDVKKILKCW